MTINNDTVIIAGNIGNDPTTNETRNGKTVINFRVASNGGYFDQRTGAWTEGTTNWYAVSAFGNIADHARASLHRGDPVIVVGRLKVKEWETNGKKGIDVEINADAIGHDLNKGTSAFVRRPRATSTEYSAAAETAPAGDAEPSDEPSASERASWEAEGMAVVDASASDDASREDELAYT
ncbi:single-strand DNA-binding protein [Microbacterium sp. W4I4]|uniref:single-stranded DNA-binding protein n=1 Tax=Microbacterium sp. W4I4 TaxID=3042295 RepID=UPI00278767AB|nr:single-stranded DNA-binding protein [Microbacterium sp. W4I4]MDQ0612679.1 single-strand DNA-binding protein [Microbacterium sp. W4I4]